MHGLQTKRSEDRAGRGAQPEAVGVNPFGYDLRRYKRIETLASREIIERVILAGIGVATIAYEFSAPTPLILFFVYCCYLLIYMWFIRQQPDYGGIGRVVVLALSTSISLVLFLSIGVFLWVMQDPIFPLVSLILLAGVMINSVIKSSSEPILFCCDIVWIGASVLFMIGWVWWGDPFTAQSIGLSVALAAVYVYFVVVSYDFGAAQRAVEASKAEFLESEKTRAVGRLTGGFAHDFNNLLTVVLGNLELAEIAETPEERDRLTKAAQQAAERGAELTNQLLALSQRARLKPEDVTAEQLLWEAVDRSLPKLGKRHRIKQQIEPNLPLLHLDRRKMVMALSGLILNARDAMPDGGVIHLEARSTSSLDGPTITIEVVDTGKGIPGGLIPYVFEPYFTTKRVGEGSGLGLPTAKGFVEQSGGRLVLTSDVGVGTKVSVHLPPKTSAPAHSVR